MAYLYTIRNAQNNAIMANALTTRIAQLPTARLENVIVGLANQYTDEANMISEAGMNELFNRYGKDTKRWNAFVARVDFAMA